MIRMLKRVIPLVVTIVLVAATTGCASSQTDLASAATDSGTSAGNDKLFAGQELTIGIWGGNDAEVNALAKVKGAFEELTGATVSFKTYTDYNVQIQADFIGGTAPDVFYIDASVFPFYSDLGVMEPLDREEMGASNFYDNLLVAFTAEDGTLYCIPKDVSTLALYINTDLLNSVGLEVSDVPRNWEEYREFLLELQGKLDDAHGVGSVTAMTVNLELARNLHLLERGGVSVSDAEGYSTMNTSGIQKNLQFIIDMMETGAYRTPQQIGLGWNGEVFGAEKTAIMEEGNWVYAVLAQEYDHINFEVLDMPAYDGEVSSMAFTVGYGIYSNTGKKELAKEWIKYATGVEGMSTWTKGAGCLPSRADVEQEINLDDDPVWAVHAKQTEYAVPWQKGKTITIIDDAYKNFVVEVARGVMSVEEALEKIDSQANAEITNSR